VGEASKQPWEHAFTGSGTTPFDSRTGLDGRGNPNGLAYDGAGHLFVVDIDRIVFEIEADGSAIVSSFELPFRGGAIAFDGRNLYVSDFDTLDLMIFDRSGNPLADYATPLRPAGLTYDPVTGLLWEINIFFEGIRQTTDTGDIVRRCESPHVPGIQGIGAITLGEDRMFVAEQSDSPPEPGTIFVLDPRALECDPPMTKPIPSHLWLRRSGDPKSSSRVRGEAY
jgi:hypothetical protein